MLYAEVISLALGPAGPAAALGYTLLPLGPAQRPQRSRLSKPYTLLLLTLDIQTPNQPHCHPATRQRRKLKINIFSTFIGTDDFDFIVVTSVCK